MYNSHEKAQTYKRSQGLALILIYHFLISPFFFPCQSFNDIAMVPLIVILDLISP